jgi:hypothetical protein
MRRSIRARIHACVPCIRLRYAYSADKREQAIQTVLQQAELLSEAWAA